MAAIAARSEAERQPVLPVCSMPMAHRFAHRCSSNSVSGITFIIDVGGCNSTALRAALADTLLVSFSPRTYDVWALDDSWNWLMTRVVYEMGFAPSR